MAILRSFKLFTGYRAWFLFLILFVSLGWFFLRKIDFSASYVSVMRTQVQLHQENRMIGENSQSLHDENAKAKTTNSNTNLSDSTLSPNASIILKTNLREVSNAVENLEVKRFYNKTYNDKIALKTEDDKLFQWLNPDTGMYMVTPSDVDAERSYHKLLKRSYWKGITAGQGHVFVGDQAFFPPCTSTEPVNIWQTEILKNMNPKNYITESKSPCWITNKDGGTSCLPYFFVIGLRKCASSDLRSHIYKHPDVARHDSALLFGKVGLYFPDNSTYNTTLRFSSATYRIKKDLTRNGVSKITLMEGNPGLFSEDRQTWHNDLIGNHNCFEPRILNSQYIKHLLPNVKVIIIYRDPVDRLFSYYRMKERNGNPSHFHKLALEGISSFQTCFMNYSMRQCVYNANYAKNVINGKRLNLSNSMYSVFIEDWLRVIPVQNFHVIRTEEYGRNTQVELTNVFTFLGLETLSERKMKQLVSDGRINVNNHNTKPILNATRHLLNMFYRPFVQRFESILKERSLLRYNEQYIEQYPWWI